MSFERRRARKTQSADLAPGRTPCAPGRRSAVVRPEELPLPERRAQPGTTVAYTARAPRKRRRTTMAQEELKWDTRVTETAL
jgi:hypothetical protein